VTDSQNTEPRVDLGVARPLNAPGLLLRPWELSEAPLLLTLADDELMKTWNSHMIKSTMAEAVAKVERSREWQDFAVWAIADLDTGELLGDIALHHLDALNSSGEIGYSVFAGARGHGVAPRAAQAVSAFAFGELGLERLELYHAVENTQSCRVALKAGFAHEGTLRKSYRYGDGELHDEHIHGRLRTD